MTYQVVLMQKAINDRHEIETYLDQENPDTDIARQFITALRRTLEVIADMPHKGNPMDIYSKKLKGLRRWPVSGFDKYLLFYVMKNDNVYVARAFHSSQII